MAKMTRVMAINMALEVVENAEAKEVLQKMLASLENKKSTPRKPSAKTLENAELRKILLEEILTDEYQNIATLKENEIFKDFTSSRMSGLLTPLVKKNKVEKEYIKKVVHFRLAE